MTLPHLEVLKKEMSAMQVKVTPPGQLGGHFVMPGLLRGFRWGVWGWVSGLRFLRLAGERRGQQLRDVQDSATAGQV